jgi:hypothetical protein
MSGDGIRDLGGVGFTQELGGIRVGDNFTDFLELIAWS